MKGGPRLRSVRVRLTLAYVGAMMVVIAVYGVVIYTSVRGNLSQALDTQLRLDFNWPDSMMSEKQALELLNGQSSFEEGGEGSPWLQVWSENGDHLLGRTYVARTNLIPEAQHLATMANDKILTLGEMAPPYRILTGKKRIGKETLVIQVAASEQPMDDYLLELLAK